MKAQAKMASLLALAAIYSTIQLSNVQSAQAGNAYAEAELEAAKQQQKEQLMQHEAAKHQNESMPSTGEARHEAQSEIEAAKHQAELETEMAKHRH